MSTAFRLFTSILLPFLLLTSCVTVRRDFVDPSFKAQGLKGSVVILKCISPVGMPLGLAPQHEREILDDAHRGILASQKNVHVLPDTGGTGNIKPVHAFEVHVLNDNLEPKVKRFRGMRGYGYRPVYLNVTRARVRRTVSARYRVVHLSTGRVVWQASGEGSLTQFERLVLYGYEGRVELRPNLGPPLPHVLQAVTLGACRKLP